MPRSLSCFVLLAVSLLLGACREQKVTSYRVPKEPEAATSSVKTAVPNAGEAEKKSAPAPAATAPAAPMTPTSAPAAAAGNTMASTPVATASGAELTWTAPTHWQSKPAGAMRKATYAIPGEGGAAELSITAFPGTVGGEVANLNRWRSQIQLPPLADAEIASAIARLEHNGLKIGLVDIANSTGSSPTRVLGAMVPHGGATWFFKVTGPDALVAKEKPVFLEFLKTVKPGLAP